MSCTKSIRSWGMVLAMLGAQLASSASHAEGTRGGGKGLQIGGDIWLADIYQLAGHENACRWTSGDTVITTNPYLQGVLSRLAKSDWYFEEDLESNIRDLSFCFIGRLVPVDTTDNNPVNINVDNDGPQIAIRMLGDNDSDEVYIDREIFSDLDHFSDRSRAFTIIHEAMHSYIPLDVERRNLSLRSAVLAIANLTDGTVNVEDYELGLRKSQVHFPGGAAVRAAERPLIEYLRGDWTVRTGVVAQMSDVRTLFHPRDFAPLIESLQGHDREIAEEAARSGFPALVDGFCDATDAAIASKIVGPLGEQGFDFLQYCMSSRPELSPVMTDLYYKSHDVTVPAKALMALLATKTVLVQDFRIMADHSVMLMSASYRDQRVAMPLTEMRAAQDETELPHELREYFAAIRRLATDGAWDQVAAITWKDPDFYQAFTIVGFAQKIAASVVPMPEEIPLAQERFREVTQAPLKILLDSMDPVSAQRLAQNLDPSKLGYVGERQ